MEEELKKLESDLIAMMDDRFMAVEDSLARLVNLGEQHQRKLASSDMTVRRFLPQFGMCVVICSALIVVPVAAAAWYLQEGKVRQLQAQAREYQRQAVRSAAFDRLYQAADTGLRLRMQNAAEQAGEQTGAAGLQ